MNKLIRVLSISALIAAQSLSASYANSANQSSALGINTNEAMDINSSMPFVDLFKLSAPFEEARPWFTKGKISYDKNGWPKNLNGGQVGTRFISNLPAKTIPAGLYTVLYKGEGKITYGADAKLVSHTSGKDIIRIRPGKNGRISAYLIIKESNPENYIRDIHVLMPGGICMGNSFKRVDEARQCGNHKFLSFEQYHEQILFNPDYLDFMKDFKVIRFMNMSGITRNDNQVHWQDRPTMSQSTWGGKEGVRGVPLEVMIELANQVNADPWFNLPHRADNTYVRNYASLVRDNLKPSLKSYIEYSNEAWNGIFSQAHYMKKMGMQMHLDKNKDQAGYKFFSRRSVEIFKIWEDVFGGTERIVRVMGAMTTNKRLSETLLGYKDAYKHTDALAIAPYFYIDQREIHGIRSIDSIFKKLMSPKNRYSIPNILKSVKAQAAIAKKYKVSLVAYEGGQHLVAYKTHTVREGPNPYLIFANKDKRMAELYYHFLQGWKQNGGTLFVAFSAPRLYTWIGSWGIKEYISQPASEAPKYQALLAFNKNQPCWWEGCRSPARAVHTVKPAVVATTRKPRSAQTQPLDPLDFGSSVANIRKVSHVAPDFSSRMQAEQHKPVIRPLQDSLPTAISSLDDKVNAFRHEISRVKDRQRVFSRNSNFRLMHVIDGHIRDSRDLAADWQAHWDPQYLHIRVDVADDNFIKDSDKPWSDDSIEIFIDADDSQLSSYDGKNDFQFMFRWKDYGVSASSKSPRRNLAGIKQKMIKTRKGYVLEASIPWRLLGMHPSVGQTIGIDVQVNDDDDGYERDGKLAWSAQQDIAWKNPSTFGQLVLTE